MTYITGDTIKILWEKKKLTQKQLAEKLMVTDKAVSQWETGRGFPDISILSELAEALSVSVPELLTGDVAANKNVSANMKRSKFYVCPICGNVIHAMGEGAFSCCGIRLPRWRKKQLMEHTELWWKTWRMSCSSLWITLWKKGILFPSSPTFQTMAFRWRSSIRNSSRNFGSVKWGMEEFLLSVTVMAYFTKMSKGRSDET